MQTTAHFEMPPSLRAYLSHLNAANIMGTGCLLSGVSRSWSDTAITPAGAALHISIVMAGVALHAMSLYKRVSLTRTGVNASGPRTEN